MGYFSLFQTDKTQPFPNRFSQSAIAFHVRDALINVSLYKDLLKFDMRDKLEYVTRKNQVCHLYGTLFPPLHPQIYSATEQLLN